MEVRVVVEETVDLHLLMEAPGVRVTRAAPMEVVTVDVILVVVVVGLEGLEAMFYRIQTQVSEG